jgi:hypothetical protein
MFRYGFDSCRELKKRSNMKKSDAYWISPKGRIIDVGITHIKSILDSPKSYGLTKDYLLDKYAEYGERVGQEGEARGKVMIDLMKSGWVRVRNYKKQDRWQFQVWNLRNREKNNIWDFVVEALKNKLAHKYSELALIVTSNKNIIKVPISDTGKIFEFKKMKKEYTILDIIKARQKEDMDDLNEASLGRVYQHYKKSPEKGFGIITAWRAGNTKKQNIELFKKLQNEIRSNGLGFFKLEGHWVECQDNNVPYDECPQTELVASIEPAIFVPGIDEALMKKLTKKYDQDASVYAGPETKGKMHLVFRDGKSQDIGKFHPGKIAQAYSKIRGKTFTFEGFEYKPQTWTEKLVEMNYVPTVLND